MTGATVIGVDPPVSAGPVPGSEIPVEQTAESRREALLAEALELATRAVAVMFGSGDVVELRVPKAGRHRTISGYFNDPAALVEAIREMDGKGPGVYVTLNPVKPDLLARASNRVKAFAETTTGDADILKRCWMLVDCDPVRPAGISSSRQELQAALDVAEKVREHLRGCKWPEPVFCLSGNGLHLLYRLPDLANTDASTSLISGVSKLCRPDSPAPPSTSTRPSSTPPAFRKPTARSRGKATTLPIVRTGFPACSRCPIRLCRFLSTCWNNWRPRLRRLTALQRPRPP